MCSGRDARGSHVAVNGECFAPSTGGADGLDVRGVRVRGGRGSTGSLRAHPFEDGTDAPEVAFASGYGEDGGGDVGVGGGGRRGGRVGVGIGFDELVEDVVDEAPVGAAAEVLERLVELARAQAAELAGTNVGEEGGGVARESLAGDGAGAEGDVRAATGGADGRAGQ